jgi:hypothetical protein
LSSKLLLSKLLSILNETLPTSADNRGGVNTIIQQE